MDFPDRFMVSGTDTGIGKTLVSAALTLGLGAVYWKPVQSGLEEETDTEFVRRVTGLSAERFRPERHRLQEPLSPHASAAIDGVEIRLEDFELPEHGERPLVVEGAGGLLVPLNDGDMIIELAVRLELPVLLVARSGLGTLNHTFLSLEALRRREVPVLGVVLNGPRNRSNREAIEAFGEAKVVAEIERLEQIDPETLQAVFTSFRR